MKKTSQKNTPETIYNEPSHDESGHNKTLHNKPRLKENTDWKDAYQSLPEVALLTSLTQSKTLTIMVIVFIALFGGFALFLLKMAGG